MKETKKQIKAQAINECAKQFRSKIESLELRLKAQVEINQSCQQRNRELQAENIRLKDELEKYEDWNRRLQEFMDMDPDSREEVITQYRTSKELNDRFSNILNMYERMFGMF